MRRVAHDSFVESQRGVFAPCAQGITEDLCIKVFSHQRSVRCRETLAAAAWLMYMYTEMDGQEINMRPSQTRFGEWSSMGNEGV